MILQPTWSKESYINTKEPFLLRKRSARSVPGTDKQQAIPRIMRTIKSPCVLSGFCRQLILTIPGIGFFTDIGAIILWLWCQTSSSDNVEKLITRISDTNNKQCNWINLIDRLPSPPHPLYHQVLPDSKVSPSIPLYQVRDTERVMRRDSCPNL